MLEIIIPTKSKALTTYGAVANEIGDVGQGLVEELILRASSTVETICGRSFALERVRQTFGGHGARGASVTLARWPVVEIHAVTANGSALPADRYELEHGVLLGGYGRVVVEYTAGYVLPGEEGRNLPHDIERVVIQLVKQDFFLHGRDPSIRSEDVDGVGSTSYFGAGSLFDAEAALARYREPVAL